MKPLDPDDPMALVGVGLDRDPDDEALAEMARCFVEEYARMGWSGERILRLFRNPFYRGPHRILRLKGEEFVHGLIVAVEGMTRQLQTPTGD
ncbi:MAG: hypothetical protein ACE5KW_05240, partial [Dehalococcoidia bacterium]